MAVRAPTNHERATMLQAGRRVASDLAAEGLNPAAGLTMADRLALCALALAVDLEASRRAGVEPCPHARDLLAGALAEVEATAA